MSGLDAYDDMMGLEYGEYEGLGQWINLDMLQDAAFTGAAGGAAILGTSFIFKQLNERFNLFSQIENPILRSGASALSALAVGLVGGRAIAEAQPMAALGVVGGVGGWAMAHFLDTLLSEMGGMDKQLPGALGDADYSGEYGGDGMDALAALESTGVTSAPGAFQGLADPTVTPEALFGLEGAVVQQETLGSYNSYMA